MISLSDLLSQSGLPGPRGNLELLYRFMREGDAKTAAACMKYATPDVKNSPEEFAAMCGVLTTAWHKRSDRAEAFAFLRPYASHASWRIREAVAMGIQELSNGSLGPTLALLDHWTSNPLERRAAVAGICEPKLLKDPGDASGVFRLLKTVTVAFDHDRKLSEEEDSLRKTLGYGWSVAVAAYPQTGKPEFTELLSYQGKHVVWIVRENLKKNRLIRIDAGWVESCRLRLEG